MLCQQCQQRPASVHVTQIVNSEKKEVHLCEHCAKEHEKIAFGNPFDFTHPFSINDFLSGFLGKNIGSQAKPQEQQTGPQCTTCGMTYEMFARSGKLGCANCYTVFSDTLETVFKRIHGNSIHTGKLPQRAGGTIKVKKEISQLKAQLNKAIYEEEYEKAAKLRDSIRELEAGIREDE